jgi:hypothetical protein
MEAPAHIVKEVERINPSIRIGRYRNKFGLIKITEPGVNVPTGDLWKSRGPIFGSSYDPVTQRAWALAFFGPEIIHSGEIYEIVKNLNTPVTPAMRYSAERYAAEVNDMQEDFYGEFGEELHWKSQRPDATSPEPCPRKHLTKEEKQILGGEHESQMPSNYDDCIPEGA